MKHLLMNPGFPDIVGEHAVALLADCESFRGANDNNDEPASDLTDPLFAVMAQREIAATRLW